MYNKIDCFKILTGISADAIRDLMSTFSAILKEPLKAGPIPELPSRLLRTTGLNMECTAEESFLMTYFRLFAH